MLDKTFQLLGGAFGPMALLMVGLTLAHTRVAGHVRGALVLTAVKNLLHPALVGLAGWWLGLRGLSLAVMVVTAALPIGANVFLFSQRYKVGEELITAAVALSTLLALLSVSLALAVVQRL